MLAGLKSSWQWTMAAAFSFSFQFVSCSLAAEGDSISAQLWGWGWGGRKSVCPAPVPAGGWTPASQLSLQPNCVLARLLSVSGSWWLTASLHSCCLPGTEGEKCLSPRNNELLKLRSVGQSVSVCRCQCLWTEVHKRTSSLQSGAWQFEWEVRLVTSPGFD